MKDHNDSKLQVRNQIYDRVYNNNDKKTRFFSLSFGSDLMLHVKKI